MFALVIKIVGKVDCAIMQIEFNMCVCAKFVSDICQRYIHPTAPTSVFENNQSPAMHFHQTNIKTKLL